MKPIIRQVAWDAGKNDLLAIRNAVFVDEQGVPAELEHDAHDRHAIHLLATTQDGRPVATARMLDDGHIGRMAVLPEWRNRGIGSAVLQELIRMAAAQGHDSVFLHAQCAAEPFYGHLGFSAEGGIFEDAGIPHRCMRLHLHVQRG
jgi:predicted GNAT family N-acyltransferase